MTFGRDRLSKDEAITVATIEGAVPALVAARDRVDQFHAMIRGRAGIGLDEWISAAADGLLLCCRNSRRSTGNCRGNHRTLVQCMGEASSISFEHDWSARHETSVPHQK
jgi:hypothetical protein